MTGSFGKGLADRAVFIAAAAIACVGLWVALRVRVTGIDQPYLMIIAQEILLGQHPEFLDFPSSFYIHVPPILAHYWLGLPIIFSWNFYLVTLTGLSAFLFAYRVPTSSPFPLSLLWFGIILLLFDDTLFGQREFLFAIFWFPYLMARVGAPSKRKMPADFLCGLLLSVTICAKFYFGAFVLLVDLPILAFRNRTQSYAAFWGMVVGGIIQAIMFLFASYRHFDGLLSTFRNYYGTVGVDYASVWNYLLGVPAVFVSLLVIVLVICWNVWQNRSSSYAIACLATGVICLALSVMQGHPRPYMIIPLFIGALASSLHVSFATDGSLPQLKSLYFIRPLGGAAIIASTVFFIMFFDNGLGRAVQMKLVPAEADYARIGPVPGDEYMTWVKANVPDSEGITVIALQYGGTSAFDPLLSTIRLGRRIDSATPILQFPLRAALVSGDRRRIDSAWDNLISEIVNARSTWIIIRRTTPAPMAADFVKIVESEPRFYSWLTSHYPQYAAFGPYVVYRASK